MFKNDLKNTWPKLHNFLTHTQKKRMNAREIMFIDEFDGKCHLWELQRMKIHKSSGIFTKRALKMDNR